MKWDAFISYSHAADGRLAPAVQQGLQRLARPWYRPRALRVFRDKTGLSANPHLWGAIEEALDDSRFFVLFISPQAAASKWVNREIEHWREQRDPGLILPVITDGDWGWDDRSGDFDPDRSTAVPEALRGAFAGEPLVLDLRWAHEEGHLDLRNGRFLDAIADLAAPMHGLTKDDLIGEDVRLHRRARRLARSAVGALALLTVTAVVAALLAVGYARSAEARRVEAVAQRLAVQSAQVDQPEIAFLLAAESYRLGPGAVTEGAVIGSAQAFSTAEVAAIFRQHDAPVTAVLDAVGADAVVAADLSGSITFTDRRTGDVIAESSTSPDVVIDLFEVGDVVVVAGRTSVQEWSITDHRRLAPPRATPTTILDADLDASGTRLVVAGADGTVSVLDRDAGSWETPVPIAADRVSGVAWSPQGDRLAVAIEDGTVAVWSMTSSSTTVGPRPLWTEPGAHAGAATAVAFSPDGASVVSGGLLGVVAVWDATTGARLSARAVHNGAVEAVGFTDNHPLGTFIASAGSDGKVGWLDATTYAPYSDVRLHTGPVNALSFGVDGTYVDGGDDGQVVFYDAEEAVLIAGRRVEMGSIPLAPAVIGGGRVVAGTPTRLLVFDSSGDETGSSLNADRIGTGATIAALAPTGEDTVLAATTTGDLVSWTVDTEVVEVVASSIGAIDRLVVDPPGTTAALLDASGTVSLWNAREPADQPRVSIPGRWLDAAFDAAGARLALGGGDGRLIIADVSTGSILAELGDPLDLVFVTATAFHPALPLLAAADGSGNIRVWDITTGQQTGVTFTGHRGSVRGLGFLGNGARLVTAGSDGTVRVWDAASGEPIGTPIAGHLLDIVAMAIDGDTVVTASADGSVLFRSLDVKVWLGEGCRLVGRDLTDEELDRFALDRPHQPVCG